MKSKSKPAKKSNAVSKLVAAKNKAIAAILALAKPADAAARKSLKSKLDRKGLPELEVELAHSKKAAKMIPTPKPAKETPKINLTATAPVTRAGRFNAKHNPPSIIKAASVAPAPAPLPVPPAPQPVPSPAPVPAGGFALPASVPPPPAIDLTIAPDAVSAKGKKRKRYVSKTDPESKYHLRDRSQAEKPVSIVRRICEAMPQQTRKEVIEACIKAGVNINTAATQYSLWKAAKKKAVALAAAADAIEDGENGEE